MELPVLLPPAADPGARGEHRVREYRPVARASVASGYIATCESYLVCLRCDPCVVRRRFDSSRFSARGDLNERLTTLGACSGPELTRVSGFSRRP